MLDLLLPEEQARQLSSPSRAYLDFRNIVWSWRFLALGSLMLNANENIGLTLMAFDHGDRGAHVLLKPVDIRDVL